MKNETLFRTNSTRRMHTTSTSWATARGDGRKFGKGLEKRRGQEGAGCVEGGEARLGARGAKSVKKQRNKAKTHGGAELRKRCKKKRNQKLRNLSRKHTARGYQKRCVYAPPPSTHRVTVTVTTPQAPRTPAFVWGQNTRHSTLKKIITNQNKALA